MPKIKSEEDILYRGKVYKNSGGAIRESKRQLVPEEDKEKILARYQKGKHGCGSVTLAKEFGYDPTTILRIVKSANR